MSKAQQLHRQGRHGEARAYSIWVDMKRRKARSHLPKFSCYKDVTVDPKWLDFDTFFAEMGVPPEGATLERNDNSLGYTKSNCRWASKVEQGRNRTSNKLALESANVIRQRYAAGDVTQQELADELGITQGLVSQVVLGKIWS